MPSRPGSRPKLANAVETGPVRGYKYEEGKLVLAHTHRMLYIFFHIHPRMDTGDTSYKVKATITTERTAMNEMTDASEVLPEGVGVLAAWMGVFPEEP